MGVSLLQYLLVIRSRRSCPGLPDSPFRSFQFQKRFDSNCPISCVSGGSGSKDRKRTGKQGWETAIIPIPW